MRKCTGCGLETPNDGFHKDASRKDGLDARCKACRRAYQQQNRDKSAARTRKFVASEKGQAYINSDRYKESTRAAGRTYKANHHTKVLAAHRAYNARNVETIREQARARTSASRRAETLKRKYGLTIENWETLFDAQGRVCAVCSTDTPPGGRWHTDHCHTLNRVRGILCGPCNQALGLLKEEPARILALHAYALA